MAFVLSGVLAMPASAQSEPRASTTLGSIGLRLVDVPGAQHNDPRTQISIVDRLAPGAAIHRLIEVSNTTTSTVHVALYASSATIEDGVFLGSDGHSANALSTWTSVEPSALDVRPGDRVIATASIAVPLDATQGEQYGAVWAEVRSGPRSGGGVVRVSRVGIRLYVSVGKGGSPATDFTIDSMTAERLPGGQPVVVALVRNRGGRALDMRGTLQLSGGPDRLRAGPFQATLGTTVGIGDTGSVAVALGKALPAGPWDARISVSSGLTERTARATITFPALGVPPAVVGVKPNQPTWLRATIALLLLGATAGLAVIINKTRPRRRWRAHRLWLH